MNITIRNWVIEDIPELTKYANNRHIWNNLADVFPSPYTEADAEEFIKKVKKDSPRKILAIDTEGQAIGSIGIFPESDIHRKNAAIAYWIAEPFWGKGIATQAVRLMLEYSFNKFEVTRIYAKPFGFNKASHSVLEKAGFKKEAVIKNGVFKNNQYFDEYIYSIQKFPL
jgi:ribosomal-protein-alanine N-acetyltransferase